MSQTDAATAKIDASMMAQNESTMIAGLARLSFLDYDRCRDEKAKELNVNVSALDAQVKSARKALGSNGEKNEMFPECEPWEQPVSGSQLLSSIRATLNGHAVLPEHADIAIALWIAMTYSMDHVQVAPLLTISSPEKRCGKTTLLSLLQKMAWRPLPSSNISPAAVYRSIEAWNPTLLIDEADTFLKENDDMRGVINSGHTRTSAFVIRVDGDGADMQPKMFSTWAAKAIAVIGNLSDTNADRSIIVKLRRKLPGEKVQKLRYAESERFDEIRSKLLRFAQDSAYAISVARPSIPDTLHDRAQDNWEPLLSIAQIAGGEWPKLALDAAIALSGGDSEAESIRAILLTDIHKVFAERKVHRISTAELIKDLTAIDEHPWSEFRNGKPLTPRQLAGLLKPFGVVPATRREADETFKGYALESFSDAFNRYLPVSDPSQRHNALSMRVSGNLTSVTGTQGVTDRKTSKTAPAVDCDGVTDEMRVIGNVKALDADRGIVI